MQQPALKSHLLERVLDRDNLACAWKRVKSNHGAPGVDGISIEDYPQWAKTHWEKTRRAIEGGYYIPSPVKRVEIPKPMGRGVRLLGIPCVNDRVIQQAIAQVRRYIEQKQRIAVDIDLSKFFDTVDHDILMSRLSPQVKDKRLLKLIGRYLRAGVMIGDTLHPTRVGVPQGGPLSPLLANIVLDDLDKYLESRALNFARYADDFVICVKSTSKAYRVKHQVTRHIERHLKLNVNEDKSRVVKTNALRFLGFMFQGKKIVWTSQALSDFKHRVRQLTKRSWGVSMQYRLRELRLYIRGWINYFGLSEYYRPLPHLDEWLRRRIRTCYLKRWHRPRTRIRQLIKLGASHHHAISVGLSSKGPYRLAKTYASQLGMNNRWLKDQGLVSIRDLWIQFHYA